MPCTPAVLNLLAEAVPVQVGEGGKEEAGGTRVASSSSSSSSNINLGSSLSTVAPISLRCHGPQVHLGRLRSHAVRDRWAGSPDGLGIHRSTGNFATDATAAGGLGPSIWWCA